MCTLPRQSEVAMRVLGGPSELDKTACALLLLKQTIGLGPKSVAQRKRPVLIYVLVLLVQLHEGVAHVSERRLMCFFLQVDRRSGMCGHGVEFGEVFISQSHPRSSELPTSAHPTARLTHGLAGKRPLRWISGTVLGAPTHGPQSILAFCGQTRGAGVYLLQTLKGTLLLA